MDSISELLQRRARDDAVKPFCLFDGSSISFADLYDRVNRLASGLAALGIHRGDRVAVMLANHPDHPWCSLGHLAYFQIPRYVELVEEFPRTPTERIPKDQLSSSVENCWDLQRSGYKVRRVN